MSNNLATLNPFDIFIGLDGKPLNAGYIYVGVAGQDPETSPVSLFWDADGLIPVALPLRTLNGYVSHNGTPARPFTNGAFSLRVRDKKGQQVFFEPNVLLSSGSNVSFVSDNGGFIAQLATNAGYIGYRIFTQAAARLAEFLGFGSVHPGLYGIAPGMAGINTPAGVDFTIGTGDAVKTTWKDGVVGVGLGVVPIDGQGQLQLAGSAKGGVKLGNVNNANANAFDWYEEGTWTPVLRFGGASVGIVYATQVGLFTRLGNMVFARMRIALTNKGSSVGVATFAGLPYAAAAIVGAISELIEGEFGAMTALGAGTRYGMSGTAGSAILTAVAYDLTGATSNPISITNASFGNGSIVDLAFSYQAV